MPKLRVNGSLAQVMKYPGNETSGQEESHDPAGNRQYRNQGTTEVPPEIAGGKTQVGDEIEHWR
jgi:hypothetical protein